MCGPLSFEDVMAIFAIAAKPTFKAKVTVVIPGNSDDGAPETHTFVAEFKRLPKDEYDAVIASLTSRSRKSEDVLAEHLVGWSGLPDLAGNDVPFSLEHRDALLQIPQIPPRLADAFVQNNSGAEIKN
jgi:hypothetical protein